MTDTTQTQGVGLFMPDALALLTDNSSEPIDTGKASFVYPDGTLEFIDSADHARIVRAIARRLQERWIDKDEFKRMSGMTLACLGFENLLQPLPVWHTAYTYGTHARRLERSNDTNWILACPLSEPLRIRTIDRSCTCVTVVFARRMGEEAWACTEKCLASFLSHSGNNGLSHAGPPFILQSRVTFYTNQVRFQIDLSRSSPRVFNWLALCLFSITRHFVIQGMFFYDFEWVNDHGHVPGEPVRVVTLQ